MSETKMINAGSCEADDLKELVDLGLSWAQQGCRTRLAFRSNVRATLGAVEAPNHLSRWFSGGDEIWGPLTIVQAKRSFRHYEITLVRLTDGSALHLLSWCSQHGDEYLQSNPAIFACAPSGLLTWCEGKGFGEAREVLIQGIPMRAAFEFSRGIEGGSRWTSPRHLSEYADRFFASR